MPAYRPALGTTLSPRERSVLAGFLAGRLPAGQVHAQLALARVVAPATEVPRGAPDSTVAPAPARGLRLRPAA